ncbi:MAG: 16S rRNA (cytidine(1402)-2'-O)-methyltransferase [Alphaproteobacteria bacterium]|nr:16S rRNA (cytidine(1402)-2'-O)-methyltransferase [Alphaproteobacteria bacterium]
MMTDKDTIQKTSEGLQDISPVKRPRPFDASVEGEAVGKPARAKPGFYLVATPIGNLRDMTFRALDILSSVDLIVCEDTRVTGKLMKAYGFKKQMEVYNDHSTEKQRDQLIEKVRQGSAVAVLSDAGMPLVSDPGYKLVRRALEEGVYVTSLPGANAALMGLQLSGLPSDQFSFLGFLPPKTSAREKALQKWRDVPGTLLIYETGPRLIDSLKDMQKVLGNREASVMRELTKIYEETKRGMLSELIAHYQNAGAPKGEIVVAVGASQAEIQTEASIEEQLKAALAHMSVRDAAEVVSKATGKPKKAIYTLALKLASSS